MATPDIEKSDISDAEDEDLWASPSHSTSKPTSDAHPASSTDPSHLAQRAGELDAEQAREAGLQIELKSVRSINEVIEGVISSLERAKGNMETVSRTVTSASTLLNTWTRILSQTEHNQRLILNPSWRGASQDLADIEKETALKVQAAERRAAEEERKKEGARRRAEDEERQRQAGAATRGTRGMRGRVRGLRRAGSVSSTGYMATGGQNTSSRGAAQSTTRGGSGIARGPRGTGGRARSFR